MKPIQVKQKNRQSPVLDTWLNEFAIRHPCVYFFLVFAGIPLGTMLFVIAVVFLVMLILGTIAGWL